MAWTGPMRQLFDDEINPSAVGFTLDGKAPHKDPLLPYRARSADVVAKMRVQTVNRERIGTKVRYALGVQVGYPTLLRARTKDSRFELLIRPESGAFGLVRSIENTLRGRTFIGFVRRFAGPDGPVVHWHLTVDSAEMAHAIQQIGILDGLSGG